VFCLGTCVSCWMFNKSCIQIIHSFIHLYLTRILYRYRRVSTSRRAARWRMRSTARSATRCPVDSVQQSLCDSTSGALCPRTNSSTSSYVSTRKSTHEAFQQLVKCSLLELNPQIIRIIISDCVIVIHSIPVEFQSNCISVGAMELFSGLK